MEDDILNKNDVAVRFLEVRRFFTEFMQMPTWKNQSNKENEVL